MNNVVPVEPVDTQKTAAPPAAQALWRRYCKTRESQVEGHLLEEYLPLLKHIVGRLAMAMPSHVSHEDLHSAGLVGLLQAVRSYDPQGGASFETYARFRIRGAVIDELRRMDWVPRLIHDKSRKVQNAITELEQKTGTPPTEAETAAVLGISLKEYERWLEEIRPVTFICLDSAGHNGSFDGSTLHETIIDESQPSPADGASRNELKEIIFKRLNQLPEMQKKVLSLYYLEGLRLREIAAAYNLTESRICQIHSQAILALRSYVEKQERALTLEPATDCP